MLDNHSFPASTLAVIMLMCSRKNIVKTLGHITVLAIFFQISSEQSGIHHYPILLYPAVGRVATRKIDFLDAFVQEKLEEEVFLELPAMFSDENQNSTDEAVILKLNK